MSKPVIFTISAAWDEEAAVWSGHCDDIPAAADAPTLDELLAKDLRYGARSLAGQPPGHRPRIPVSPDHGAARGRAGRSLNGAAVRPAVARSAARRRLHAGSTGQRQPRNLAQPPGSRRPFFGACGFNDSQLLRADKACLGRKFDITNNARRPVAGLSRLPPSQNAVPAPSAHAARARSRPSPRPSRDRR